MIIALSVKKAREFEKMMQKCEIKKEYVCKVKGEFPRYGLFSFFSFWELFFIVGAHSSHYAQSDTSTFYLGA